MLKTVDFVFLSLISEWQNFSEDIHLIKAHEKWRCLNTSNY